MFEDSQVLVQSENSNENAFLENLVWTIGDVAKFFSCSERHVRDLVAKDRVPFFKIGRLVRFHKHQVIEWLQKGGTR